MLSELLYMNYDIILFALEIEDLRNERSEKKILLNPADFVIPSKDDFKIQVVDIAELISRGLCMYVCVHPF